MEILSIKGKLIIKRTTTMEKLVTGVGELELNGNCPGTNESTEDLSEYTDADESLSAPIEILAEFLSAVMLKDYEKALKYCKIILEYEPNHSTAKEFYPLIQEKINQGNQEMSSSSDQDWSASPSDEDDEERADDEDDDDEEEEEVASEEYSSGVESSGGASSNPPRDSDATSGSYSSLEDEEAAAATQPRILQERHDNDFSQNGNNTPPTTDSESPTEPVSQNMQASVFPVAF
ncbi:glutamate-rich protein 2 isoform X2 [Cimex lectularius]|uniref:Glutamate-rich protein 2 n=1 Tax=Cimex lectularius TaxID=79782 RepID=A0A8I6SDV7_CIMLE|nr:glutamate-rich protein 2 isoform X2 [Cimex lectularius]